jgi:hypothetical protein
VGKFEEAQSMSCGICWTGETPQTPKAVRRLTASPEEELLMKKPAVGLFHILPAESEATGTEISSLVFPPINI